MIRNCRKFKSMRIYCEFIATAGRYCWREGSGHGAGVAPPIYRDFNIAHEVWFRLGRAVAHQRRRSSCPTISEHYAWSGVRRVTQTSTHYGGNLASLT